MENQTKIFYYSTLAFFIIIIITISIFKNSKPKYVEAPILEVSHLQSSSIRTNSIDAVEVFYALIALSIEMDSCLAIFYPSNTHQKYSFDDLIQILASREIKLEKTSARLNDINKNNDKIVKKIGNICLDLSGCFKNSLDSIVKAAREGFPSTVEATIIKSRLQTTLIEDWNEILSLTAQFTEKYAQLLSEDDKDHIFEWINVMFGEEVDTHYNSSTEFTKTCRPNARLPIKILRCMGYKHAN